MLTSCGDASTDASRFGGRVFRRTPGTDAVDATKVNDGFTDPGYPIEYHVVGCPFPTESAHGLNVECGELVVPMDRSAPRNGKTVKLAVARIRSPSPTPAPDPVVYLEGGPGGSAISSVEFWTSPVAPFLENRDLILIDQRGTGYSKPRLVCEKLTDDIYGAQVGVFAEECLRIIRNQGIDVSNFNTTESAADLADLRRALQLKQYNLFGISYGTRLALWTMQTQPQGIRSVVIDSVYPPGIKKLPAIPVDLQRSVRAIGADCDAQPACVRAFPDLEGQLVSAIDKLNARTPGLGDNFTRALFQALYQSDIAPDIPKAISLANRGDVNGAARLLSGEGARARNPNKSDQPPPGYRSRPHMTEALYHSIECAEAVPLSTPDEIRAAGRSLPASLAKALVDDGLREMALCQVWKVPAVTLTDVHSAIPTLVLAGQYDPITPPEWAERAASTLSRAQFQLVNGSGHGTWTAGDCPKQAVTQFLNDPLAPSPDCSGAPPRFAL